MEFHKKGKNNMLSEYEANTESLTILIPPKHNLNLNNGYKTFLLGLSLIPGFTIIYYGDSIVAKFCPSTACQAGFAPIYLIAFLVLGGFHSRVNIQLLRDLPIIFKGKKISLGNLFKIGVLLPLNILSGISIGYLHLDVGEKLSLPKAFYWTSAGITTLMTGLANYIPTLSLYTIMENLFYLEIKAARCNRFFLLEHLEDTLSQRRDMLKNFLTRINLAILQLTPKKAAEMAQSLPNINEETLDLNKCLQLLQLSCQPIKLSHMIWKDLLGILTFGTAMCGNYMYFLTGLKAGLKFTNSEVGSYIIGSIAGIFAMLVRSTLAFSAANRLSTNDHMRISSSLIGILGALSLAFCQAGIVISLTDPYSFKQILSFVGLMLGGLGISIAGIVNLFETKDLLPCVTKPIIKPSTHSLLTQYVNKLIEICNNGDEETINKLFTCCYQVTKNAEQAARNAIELTQQSSEQPEQYSIKQLLQEQKSALIEDPLPRESFCNRASNFLYSFWHHNPQVKPALPHAITPPKNQQSTTQFHSALLI